MVWVCSWSRLPVRITNASRRIKTALWGAAGGGSSGDAWYAVYTGAYDSSNSYGDFDIGLDTTNRLYVGGRGTKTDQNYARLLGVFTNYKTAPTFDATNSQFDTQSVYIGNDSYTDQYISTNGYFDRPGKSPIVGCYGPANGSTPSAGYSNLWYFLADSNLSNPADLHELCWASARFFKHIRLRSFIRQRHYEFRHMELG